MQLHDYLWIWKHISHIYNICYHVLSMIYIKSWSLKVQVHVSKNYTQLFEFGIFRIRKQKRSMKSKEKYVKMKWSNQTLSISFWKPKNIDWIA